MKEGGVPCTPYDSCPRAAFAWFAYFAVTKTVSRLLYLESVFICVHQRFQPPCLVSENETGSGTFTEKE